MRLTTACFLLSAMAASTAVAEEGVEAQGDLLAMSEAEIEGMDEDAREAAERKEEDDEANADEGADEASGQSHWSKPGGWDYCKKRTCGVGEGDCDKHSECGKGLYCGRNNCGKGYHPLADCCEKMKPFHRDYCKYHKCDYGEGDCDCHRECARGLKCGVNNCRRMHPGKHWIPKWADCCTHCSSVKVGPPGMKTTVPAEHWDADKKVVGGDRTLVKPTPVLEDAAVFNLPSLTASDEIKIKCCRYQKDKCEFFVTVYHCKPCSEDHNGGLPGHLLSAGWDSGSCAPRFELPGDMSGTTHGMTTFHRTLYPGETETIPLSKGAPHVAVFERTGLIAGPWCPPNKGPFPPGPGCACIPALL